MKSVSRFLLAGAVVFAIITIQKYLKIEQQIRAYNPGDPSSLLNSADAARGFLTRLERDWENAAPGSQIVFKPIKAIDNVATGTRVTIEYHGEMLIDATLHTVIGEIRSYFYDTGRKSIDGTCFTAISDCDELAELIPKIEIELLTKLNSDSIENVLPTDGQDCWADSAPDTLGCFYPPGTVVAVRRLPLVTKTDLRKEYWKNYFRFRQ